jgi:hypothetical protein
MTTIPEPEQKDDMSNTLLNNVTSLPEPPSSPTIVNLKGIVRDFGNEALYLLLTSEERDFVLPT